MVDREGDKETEGDRVRETDRGRDNNWDRDTDMNIYMDMDPAKIKADGLILLEFVWRGVTPGRNLF
jgi:hypothetical protein